MDKNRLLWMLVVADVLLAFAAVGAEGFFGWTLPPELRQFEHERITASPFASFGSVIHLGLLVTTTCLALLSWIGLVSYWPIARKLYLVSLASWILLVLFSGPSVRTPISLVFSMLDALVAGVILGLVYFSDLARRFERTPSERAVAAGLNLGIHRA